MTTSAGLCVGTGVDFAAEDDPATPQVETRRTKANPEAGVVAIGVGLGLMIVGGTMLGVSDSVAQGKPATPPPMMGNGNAPRRGRGWP